MDFGVAEIDLRQFNAVVRDLSRISGADFKVVLRQQVARVLEICVKRSPGIKGPAKAAREKVRLRVEKPARYIGRAGTLVSRGRAPRQMHEPVLQTLTGTRGGTAGAQYLVQRDRAGKPFWLRFQGGASIAASPISQGNRDLFGALYGQHLALLAQLQGKADDAVAAMGSLRKSWLQIAEKLGLDLRIPKGSFVRKARTGHDDGARSRWEQDGAQFFADCVNTNSLLIRRYNAAAIVQGALQTRAKAFAIEMEKGVFDNVKTRASRYPGIFTTP